MAEKTYPPSFDPQRDIGTDYALIATGVGAALIRSDLLHIGHRRLVLDLRHGRENLPTFVRSAARHRDRLRLDRHRCGRRTDPIGSASHWPPAACLRPPPWPRKLTHLRSIRSATSGPITP